jgi:hypothetical protein
MLTVKVFFSRYEIYNYLRGETERSSLKGQLSSQIMRIFMYTVLSPEPGSWGVIVPGDHSWYVLPLQSPGSLLGVF